MIYVPAIARSLFKTGKITVEEYERFKRWNKGGAVVEGCLQLREIDVGITC